MPSCWDPNPGDLRATDISHFEPAGCKMMLIEIIRRAAHDWILYRTSTRLNQKQIAEEAYEWLFNEEPGTPMWVERATSKKEITSLFGICEVLGLEPDVVRAYVRRLTVKEILSTGRPPTYRRQKEKRSYALPPKELAIVTLPPTPLVVVAPPSILLHACSTSSASLYIRGLVERANRNRQRLLQLLS